MAEAANGEFRGSIPLKNGAVTKENLVIRAEAVGCFYKLFSDFDLLGAVSKALKH